MQPGWSRASRYQAPTQQNTTFISNFCKCSRSFLDNLEQPNVSANYTPQLSSARPQPPPVCVSLLNHHCHHCWCCLLSSLSHVRMCAHCSSLCPSWWLTMQIANTTLRDNWVGFDNLIILVVCLTEDRITVCSLLSAKCHALACSPALLTAEQLQGGCCALVPQIG